MIKMKYFFTSDNVSLSVIGGDEARKALAQKEGFDITKLTCAEQVHGVDVVVVGPSLVGCGALDLESRVPKCDALVTNLKGVCLMMLTADCVPVLLYDKQREVAAAIHAGWKGTAGRIVCKSIEKMIEAFGCYAKDIEAYIGPSICGECFEVGDEVIDAIGKRFVTGMSKNGKALLDLKSANAIQMAEMGVDPLKIKISKECTYHDRLASWRREKCAERIGSGIWLE